MLDQIKSHLTKASTSLAKLFGYEDSITLSDLKRINQFNLSMNYHVLSNCLPYESYDEISNLFFNKKGIGFFLYMSFLLGSS